MADRDKLLHYALENGILDMSIIECQIDTMKRKEILRNQKIWQGKNGRWYTYLPDGRGGRRQVSKKNLEDLENAIVGYHKQESDNPTIHKLFDNWIKQKAEFEDILPATVAKYKRDYKRFFSDFGKRRIRNLSAMDIEIFVKSSVLEKQLSRKSFGSLRTVMYGIFKYAKKRGYIDYSIQEVFSEMEISKKSFQKKERDDSKEIFFESEEQKIMAQLKNNPDTMNLGLMLLFKSGLRVGELVALKPADVSGNRISVNKTETTYTDNGHLICEIRDSAKTEAGNRTVIIPDDAMWIIRKLRTDNPFGEWLFMKNGKRIRAECFRRRLVRVCNNAGVESKSPHKIRKTYGTKLIESKVPERMVCEQMGHTDISCTQKYYYYNRLDDSQKVDVINAVSSL